jgi:hypothetical protein
MASTILSALSERVLHHNGLATVTDNWIVVRDAQSRSQSVLSIDSLSAVKTSKTFHLIYLAWAAGCLLIAVATECSKEASRATLPFALVGLALLTAAQVTRRAAISFVLKADVVQTPFGTLREAATLVAAVRFVQEGKLYGREPAYSQVLWVRAYLALLV